MGTTGLIGQAYGRKDDRDILLILIRALLSAVIIGLVIILLKSLIAEVSFSLIHGSEAVEKFAGVYFYIRIYAAPAVLALYVFQGWFFGMQNARYPLYIMVSLNIVNIFFNVLFVRYMGMNADGVALGTVLAQYFGLIFAIVLFIREVRIPADFVLTWQDVLNWKAIKKFFRVNFDIFIRTIALIFAFSFFTAKSAEFGDSILAANTILLQLWTIFAYGVDGFAYAAESLVAKYKGAMDYKKMKRTVYYLFIWGISMGAAVTLIYILFLEEITALFTSNEQIALLVFAYAGWTIYTPVVNSVCYIWDGIYIGATATKAMRNAMLFVTLAVYIPVYYLTKDSLGNNGLWLSLIFFMFMRGAVLTFMAKWNIFNR
jgi:MATE family multidrug resistance protein